MGHGKVIFIPFFCSKKIKVLFFFIYTINFRIQYDYALERINIRQEGDVEPTRNYLRRGLVNTCGRCDSQSLTITIPLWLSLLRRLLMAIRFPLQIGPAHLLFQIDTSSYFLLLQDPFPFLLRLHICSFSLFNLLLFFNMYNF